MALHARLSPLQEPRQNWPWHQVKSVALPVSACFAGDRRMEAETYLRSGFGLRAALEAQPHGWSRFSQFANVWQPTRTKGILVSPEYGIPFLAATQVFDLRPIPRKWLALSRTSNAESLYVKPGMILVTRSGAVGRATIAYTPHKDTLISDDLLRVEARDAKNWGWIYAYLRSDTVREMMTTVQYGHVIKHLETSHLNALPVPELPDALLAYFNKRVSAILHLREQAYAATLEAEARFAERIGPLPPTNSGETGFVVQAKHTIFSKHRRIDAWPNNPTVHAIKSHLASNNRLLMDIQECGYHVWVPGRYKRLPASEGVTFVDSSDLFEINPDLVKRFADCSFGDQYRGRVKQGWLLMASSGQTYGIIGGVALANAFLENKAVANHVIRIAPISKSAVRPGYLMTVLSHPLFGRPVVKSYAFGSSVPEIIPEDVRRFQVVRLAADDENYIADCAEKSAQLRAEADILENEIAGEAEHLLTRFVLGEEREMFGVAVPLRLVSYTDEAENGADIQSDTISKQTDVNAKETLDTMPQARPDRFFTAEQIRRLQFLMRRSQEAAERTGPMLTPEEEAERNALIDAELIGSGQRAAAYAEMLGK